jgi:hypothetical protein
MSEIPECGRCQTPVADGALFCHQCGEEFAGNASTDVHARLRDRLSRTVGDRYRIGELLGAGGMGVVFLADDLKHQRKVAIKVLSPTLAGDAKIVERFGREARTSAGLDHPGIVPIYDAGSEGGIHYFVMQYVAGRPLDEVLREQSPAPVSIAFATRVLREAAAALGHAHRRGVVHRDVKPENIIIDANGRVLLADFGISKVVDGTADATTVRKLTQTGGIIGTPHYMAPEHALGLGVDGRTDQYALAVVGFQMLAGRVPFDDETLLGIIHLHINTAAPRLSSLRPELPPHLASAIARAMSKAPVHRFGTMEEFAAAVAGPSAMRRPRAAWLFAAVLVGALVGGVYWAERTGWTISRLRTAAGVPVTTPAPAQRELARFDLTSSPRATLYIDGKRIGMTPIVDGRLSIGVHEIRLERSGYRTVRDTITVARSVRRNYSLRPATR